MAHPSETAAGSAPGEVVINEINGRQRYAWVDAMKFLGIFAIYTFHFGSTGRLNPFLFSYCVQMFFFISGFFAKHAQAFIPALVKRFLSLMIPYYGFFAIGAIAVLLQTNDDGAMLPQILQECFSGIRNQPFVGTLWFLPCLFVASTIYDILSRIIKAKPILIALALILNLLNGIVLPDHSAPSWVLNIDGALYYLLFYAIGAAVFPYLRDFSWRKLKRPDRVPVVVVSVSAFVITAIFYFYGLDAIVSSLPPFHTIPSKGLEILCPLTIIFVNFIVAKLLARVSVLTRIGQGTLILCGLDMLLKDAIGYLFLSVGLSLRVTNPYAACLFSLLLILLAHFTLIPLINRHFPWLAGKPKWGKAP